MRISTGIFVSILALSMTGCGSQTVPPAHKGRTFDKTGPAALWVGGRGFEGPVLGPGTYYTGMYPEIRMVECGQRTVNEGLTALTKDGVQFKLDVYVNYSATCDDDEVVKTILDRLSPESSPVNVTNDKEKKEDATSTNVDPEMIALTVTADQVYRIFIRPALSEAVRESISPYIANDVNPNREKMFEDVKKSFDVNLKKQKPLLVSVYSLNLSNLDFPEAMVTANTERAAQAIQRDKAVAAREKVQAEIETARLEVVKSEVEAQAQAKKIEVIGKALHENPEYYIRDVYYYAAEKGGSIVLPSNPNTILQITPKRP